MDAGRRRTAQRTTLDPVNARPEDPAAASLQPPGHDQPLPAGDRNMNPPGLGLLALWREDFATHDRRWFDPGLLAVAVVSSMLLHHHHVAAPAPAAPPAADRLVVGDRCEFDRRRPG